MLMAFSYDMAAEVRLQRQCQLLGVRKKTCDL